MAGYPQEFQNDILETFELHFTDGISEGKTEEEVIQELGSVEEVMENIRTMYAETDQSSSQSRKTETQNDSSPFETASEEFNRSMNSFSEGLRQSLNSLNEMISRKVSKAAQSVDKAVNEAMEQREKHPDDFNFEFHFDPESSSSRENRKTGTLDAAQITNIVVESGDQQAEVSLKPGESLSYVFNPNVSVFSKPEELLVVVSGDTAVFQITSESSLHLGARLEIMVPSNVRIIRAKGRNLDLSASALTLQELSCDQISGDTDLSQIGASRLVVFSHSGDLTMDSCHIDTMNVSLSSGDFSGRELTGDLTVKAQSGDLSLDGMTGSLTAELKSGDAEITRAEGSKAEVRSVSGEVEFTGTYETMYLSSGSGDVSLTCGQQVRDVLLQSTCGDLELDRREAGDDICIQVHCGIGDFENRTGLPHTSYSSRSYSIGNGSRKFFLKTVSGDIEVR